MKNVFLLSLQKKKSFKKNRLKKKKLNWKFYRKFKRQIWFVKEKKKNCCFCVQYNWCNGFKILKIKYRKYFIKKKQKISSLFINCILNWIRFLSFLWLFFFLFFKLFSFETCFGSTGSNLNLPFSRERKFHFHSFKSDFPVFLNFN